MREVLKRVGSPKLPKEYRTLIISLPCFYATLRLTQSGVSGKILRIEERLSTQIFNRTNKSLSLTLEGEILLDYAGRILSVHDEAVSRLTKPKASGELPLKVLKKQIENGKS